MVEDKDGINKTWQFGAAIWKELEIVQHKLVLRMTNQNLNLQSSVAFWKILKKHRRQSLDLKHFNLKQIFKNFLSCTKVKDDQFLLDAYRVWKHFLKLCFRCVKLKTVSKQKQSCETAIIHHMWSCMVVWGNQRFTYVKTYSNNITKSVEVVCNINFAKAIKVHKLSFKTKKTC